MKDQRKHIKVVIPADMVQQFNQAKVNAEQELMIKLSDTQYATRVLTWALGQQENLTSKR